MDKIHARIQESVYTKAEWEAANPVLLKGEKGFVSDDPNLFKIGDGVTAWNSLPWRGYTGTISQVTGDNENAVMSQKATVAAIKVETDRAMTAEEANAQAITDEVARAQEAELANTTAIEAEKNRAEAAEEANATAIIGTDRIADRAVTINKMPSAMWESSDNLWDDLSVVYNSILNTNTGELKATNLYDTSDFIKISPNIRLVFGNNGKEINAFVCEYDNDKNYLNISGQDINTYNTSENCAFVRVSFVNSYSKKQVYKDSLPSQYKPSRYINSEISIVNSAVTNEKIADGAVTFKKLANNVDDEPTGGSNGLVKSGGIFSYIGKHKNAILEIINADPSSLNSIPYGVVEIGVHDSATYDGNIYLKRCCYRSITNMFYFEITNSEGAYITNYNYNIQDINGLIKLSGGRLGYFELIIDCDWLKSNPIDNMNLELTAPISLEKLKSTTYSQLLKEKDKLDINCGYRICNTSSNTQVKEVPVNANNKILVVGQVGKVKMTYSNSFVPTDTENVKMRMGDTGEYDLYYNGKPVSNENTWDAGDVLDCYFDGERYYLTPLADNSTFVGTDGSDNGKKGFVPAPTSEQQDYILSSDGSWKRNDGYIIKTEVNVNTSSQRNVNFNLKPGTRIAVKVSNISGTVSTYNLYWTKSGENELIFRGYPLGYMSEELIVPDDATGITIFMDKYASGNVTLIEVFDASHELFLKEKLTYNLNGFEYLNNRQVINIHTTLEVTSDNVEVFSINDGRLKDLKGNLYAFITGTAKLNNEGYIRFYFTDNSVTTIHGLNMRQSKLFKFDDNKTLKNIIVYGNSIVTEGDLDITVFSIEQSQNYLNYPLYGKNIMCFGDSLTEFKIHIDNYRYTDHLQNISQANVYNAGIGGTRLVSRTTLSLTPNDQQQCIAAFDIAALIQAWSTKDFSYQDAAIASGYLGDTYQTKFEKKLAVLKNNPIENFDIVTIFGGHNDYNGGSVIGTKEYSNYDIYTVCGAINNSIKQINTANPKIQIYMYGLIPMIYNDGGTNIYSDDYIPESAPSYEGHQLTAYEFSNIIHDVAKLNHIPFDDWYWDCGLNRYNHNEYYPIQGDLHPYTGFEYIAKKIYKFLLSK